jgi:hypothetical protein
VTFISQAIVLERTSVFGAFARTWALVDGSWWRVFGITILLALMVAIIQGAIGGVVGALLSVAHGTVARVVSTGITSVVGIVVQPVQLGGMTLLYYDLRVRREGFDLELAVSAMDAPAPE